MFRLLFIVLIFMSGCSCSEGHSQYSESSPVYLTQDNDEASELENPYSEGTGHQAGYDWAERNSVSSCGGKSESFIEGCEEYLRQQEAAENLDDGGSSDE